MAHFTTYIHRIESAIHQLRTNPDDLAKARRTIRDSLQALASLEADPSLSLAETFEAIADRTTPTSKAHLGALSIRLISSPDILPPTVLERSRPHVVRLIENGCPSLAQTLSLPKNAQNHQKLEAFKTLHSTACDRLTSLREPFTSLQDLSARRPIIMQTLNYGPTKSYFATFGFDSVLPSVSSLLKLVDNAASSEGHTLQLHTQDLLDNLADDLAQYQPMPTFVAQEYFLPFLVDLQRVAAHLQDTMAERFACTISVSYQPLPHGETLPATPHTLPNPHLCSPNQ